MPYFLAAGWADNLGADTAYAISSLSEGNLTMLGDSARFGFLLLIFLYFSLIFLTVIWAFLPGCRVAILSISFIVSSLSLTSSVTSTVGAEIGLL